MKKSTHRIHAPLASWLTLLGAFTLIVLPSCSAPQTSSSPTSSLSAAGGLLPPRLATDGESSAPGNSGSRFVVVNPNPNTALRVDYVRLMPDQSRSITSRTDVPPGESAVIGSRTMNGARCSYQLTGWTKTHSVETVAKAQAHHAPTQLTSVSVADAQ